MFLCQVGHAYSATTLVAGKEERLEEVLWSGVYLLEELADLLADLIERRGGNGSHPEWPAAARRIDRLREQASRLRQLLAENEPIAFGEGVAAKRDTP